MCMQPSVIVLSASLSYGRTQKRIIGELVSYYIFGPKSSTEEENLSRDERLVESVDEKDEELQPGTHGGAQQGKKEKQYSKRQKKATKKSKMKQRPSPSHRYNLRSRTPGRNDHLVAIKEEDTTEMSADFQLFDWSESNQSYHKGEEESSDEKDVIIVSTPSRKTLQENSDMNLSVVQLYEIDLQNQISSVQAAESCKGGTGLVQGNLESLSSMLGQEIENENKGSSEHVSMRQNGQSEDISPKFPKGASSHRDTFQLGRGTALDDQPPGDITGDDAHTEEPLENACDEGEHLTPHQKASENNLTTSSPKVIADITQDTPDSGNTGKSASQDGNLEQKTKYQTGNLDMIQSPTPWPVIQTGIPAGQGGITEYLKANGDGTDTEIGLEAGTFQSVCAENGIDDNNNTMCSSTAGGINSNAPLHGMASSASRLAETVETFQMPGNSNSGSVDTDATLQMRGNSPSGPVDTDGTLQVAGNSPSGLVDTDGTLQVPGNSTSGLVNTDGTHQVPGNSPPGPLDTDETHQVPGNSTLGPVDTDRMLQVPGKSPSGLVNTDGTHQVPGNSPSGPVDTDGTLQVPDNSTSDRAHTDGTFLMPGKSTTGLDLQQDKTSRLLGQMEATETFEVPSTVSTPLFMIKIIQGTSDETSLRREVQTVLSRRGTSIVTVPCLEVALPQPGHQIVVHQGPIQKKSPVEYPTHGNPVQLGTCPHCVTNTASSNSGTALGLHVAGLEKKIGNSKSLLCHEKFHADDGDDVADALNGRDGSRVSSYERDRMGEVDPLKHVAIKSTPPAGPYGKSPFLQRQPPDKEACMPVGSQQHYNPSGVTKIQIQNGKLLVQEDVDTPTEFVASGRTIQAQAVDKSNAIGAGSDVLEEGMNRGESYFDKTQLQWLRIPKLPEQLQRDVFKDTIEPGRGGDGSPYLSSLKHAHLVRESQISHSPPSPNVDQSDHMSRATSGHLGTLVEGSTLEERKVLGVTLKMLPLETTCTAATSARMDIPTDVSLADSGNADHSAVNIQAETQARLADGNDLPKVCDTDVEGQLEFEEVEGDLPHTSSQNDRSTDVGAVKLREPDGCSLIAVEATQKQVPLDTTFRIHEHEQLEEGTPGVPAGIGNSPENRTCNTNKYGSVNSNNSRKNLNPVFNSIDMGSVVSSIVGRPLGSAEEACYNMNTLEQSARSELTDSSDYQTATDDEMLLGGLISLPSTQRPTETTRFFPSPIAVLRSPQTRDTEVDVTIDSTNQTDRPRAIQTDQDLMMVSNTIDDQGAEEAMTTSMNGVAEASDTHCDHEHSLETVGHETEICRDKLLDQSSKGLASTDDGSRKQHQTRTEERKQADCEELLIPMEQDDVNEADIERSEEPTPVNFPLGHQDSELQEERTAGEHQQMLQECFKA